MSKLETQLWSSDPDPNCRTVDCIVPSSGNDISSDVPIISTTEGCDAELGDNWNLFQGYKTQTYLISGSSSTIIQLISYRVAFSKALENVA